MMEYDQGAAKRELCDKLQPICADQQDQTGYCLPIPTKRVCPFDLNGVFVSTSPLTFLFNSAERTTVTSRLLLQAFCKKVGKEETAECSVKLQEFSISEVQVLFLHILKRNQRKVVILHGPLSLQDWVKLSHWCQSRQSHQHLHWSYFTCALRQSDSTLWPLTGMQVSDRSLWYG